MKIYRLKSFEHDEDMFLMKDLRNDIFIEIGGEIYSVFFIGRQRFIQEFDDEISGGYFIPNENTVVLNSIEQNAIVNQLAQIGEGKISLMKHCRQNGDSVFLNLTESEKRVYSECGWRTSFKKSELIFIADR